MQGRFPQFHPSKRQRVTYFACVFFVLSYIAFDVLDLDGSSLPSFIATFERLSILAVIAPEVELSYSSDQIEHYHTIKSLVADAAKQYARRHPTGAYETSLLELVRAHGWRTSLARNSLPG